MTLTVEDRFWAKATKGFEWECWVWAASTNDGYGRFKVGPRKIYAHRFAYELLVGPIPERLTLDHLCRNRACVNPAHLEPVTMRENVLRGESNAARNASKSHCPQGHPYDDENTKFDKRPYGVSRRCRTCERDRWRAVTPEAEGEGEGSTANTGHASPSHPQAVTEQVPFNPVIANAGSVRKGTNSAAKADS